MTGSCKTVALDKNRCEAAESVYDAEVVDQTLNRPPAPPRTS